MENVEWYYAADGRQMGPVSEAALRGMLGSRQVSPNDLVWREGMSDWQPAGTRAELAQQTAPPPVTDTNLAPAPLPPRPFDAGMPTAALPNAPQVQDYQGMAIAAFVVSLVGIGCVGIILGPIAIVLAAVAMNNMKRSGNFKGKGLATAGLVIGIVDFGLFFAWMALQVAFGLFR